MAELVFLKSQYGLEAASAHGTAVAATKLWPGTVSIPADRKPQFKTVMSGRRTREQQGVINQILVDGLTLKMEQGAFQALPMLFSGLLKGAVTASETTPSQGDYAWSFTPSLSAANNPDSFTLEWGDDVQAYEAEYLMFNALKIAGALGDDAGVSLEATGFAKQITPTTFTPSLSALTYEFMVANMTKLYIDTAWAGLGGTQVTGLLGEFSLELMANNHPKFLADGVKTFTTHGEGAINALATFTLEGNSTADAQFDLFQAGTKRAIRLEVIGSQIGTGTTHKLTVDMFGQWESVIPLASEKNGNNRHAAIFHVLDDNQATPHSLGVSVTTSVNAV